MREQFEKKYREMHPDDKCTLMPNGNYSGWMKQARWDGWQMRQAEVDHLIEMNKKSVSMKPPLGKHFNFNLLDHLTEMNQRYIGKMQEQQDQIAELKAEFNELLAFNENLDRERNTYRDQAQKYKSKVLMIGSLLCDCSDQDMTLKAIKTVVERVGEF